MALTRVAESWLQGRVVDVDPEGLNLGVVEQVVPVHASHLVATLDFLQVPVGPEQPILEHGQRKRMLNYSHLEIAHMSYIYKLKANFYGREKEGHFHYKNFLRALK